MPHPTTEQFSKTQLEIAKIAKALGHPARIAILDILKAEKACICHEIVLQIPLAQSTVSQHLKVLKEAGLIKGEISSTNRCYCIDPEGWAKAARILNDFTERINPLDHPCCG